MAAADACYADQALREVVRRLLGQRPGTEQPEERLDPATPAQAAAWAQTAKYLEGRIQDKPEQKPGRQPDMGAAAGAAMKAVLAEVKLVTTEALVVMEEAKLQVDQEHKVLTEAT